VGWRLEGSRNDRQVDGSRVGISVKTGYVPTPDVVQEVNVPLGIGYLDRQFRTVNLDRQQMYGGTVGHPILENRLFNFVSFEGWKWNQAAALTSRRRPPMWSARGISASR
jgi:hypothetical protein